MNIHTNQVNTELITHISKLSRSFFAKGFFGVSHGAISARIAKNRFVINKQNVFFDDIDENSMMMLYQKQDYRWNEASIHAPIHSSIYEHFSEAKFIAYAMPPYALSYSLKYKFLVPKDYFGHKYITSAEIFDPKEYESWEERADSEIPRYFREHPYPFMIIKGYGIYVYARDIYTLAKSIALIEHTCKILHYNAELESLENTPQPNPNPPKKNL